MPSTKKKNIQRKKRNKKKTETVIIVTKTIVPANETLFPEKLKRVNALLKKSKLMDMPDK